MEPSRSKTSLALIAGRDSLCLWQLRRPQFGMEHDTAAVAEQ